MKRPFAIRRARPNGHRPRYAWLVWSLLALVGLGAGIGLARFGLWNFHLKRFDVVKEGVLYRSAQPTEHGFHVLVERFGVRSIACLRRENAPVRQDLWDFSDPSGEDESDTVSRLGARFLHWPMGGEAYWPWFSGQQFDDFFRLMDEPANFPIAVHCIGGRHRTGTFVALYRLEYQRWSIEDALREMYTFDFGEPAPVQDHNLRTYVPRPLPDEAEWSALRSQLGSQFAVADFGEFVGKIRRARGQSVVEKALANYLRTGQPFALCLAQRLIDSPSDPLVTHVLPWAEVTLRNENASPRDLAAAVGLVADFGQPAQQSFLLQLLTREPLAGPPSPRYQALVQGVTGRYRANRIPYLLPILKDERPRVEPTAMQQVDGTTRHSRYCDTAVARLCTILDRWGVLAPSQWEDRRQLYLGYLAEHPEALRLTQLGKHPYDAQSDPAARIEDRDDYR